MGNNVASHHTNLHDEESSKVDAISNLPEDITANILGRLPIDDRIRTGILSRNWRYKWTTLPDLVIDDPSIGLPWLMRVDEYEISRFISGILFQHKGPISKFSLRLEFMRYFGDVDNWIQFVSNNGATTEFTLEFTKGSRYKIHSSLFSCVNLRQLKLNGCIIPSTPPKIFDGFNNLTCLKLEYVTFNNEGLENLITKCPQLSDLHLFIVDGSVDRLNIHHAPKLKSLYFNVAKMMIKFICLKHTPSLVDATFFYSRMPDIDQILENRLNNNLDSLSNLRKFKLGSYFLKFVFHYRLPSTFNHLLEVQFSRLMFEDIDSVSSALDLIRSCPNLDKLVVIIHEYPYYYRDSLVEQMKTVTDYLEERSASIASLNKLRYVEMENVTGLGPEMQFVKLILGKSPLLKEMKIQHADNVHRNGESKILKELIQFPRASAVAQILY